MNSAPPLSCHEMCDKTLKLLFISHRRTTPTLDTCREHFHNENGPVRTGTLCHRKNGNRWHGQQEDRDHAGPAALNGEAVVAEAPLGGRDVVAQRRATTRRGGSCVSCVACVSRRE